MFAPPDAWRLTVLPGQIDPDEGEIVNWGEIVSSEIVNWAEPLQPRLSTLTE